MSGFEPVWASLIANLKPGTTIKNWTILKGDLGDQMTIVSIRQNYVEVDTPRATNNQVVPKSDFERVWEVWPDYKAQKLRRYEIRDMTRFSKYIISIFHWLEERQYGRS